MKIPPVKDVQTTCMKLTNKSVEVLDKCGKDFLYLLSKFLNLSNAKVKGEIFVAQQIRRVMYDVDFGGKLKSIELVARKSITLFFIGFVCSQNKEHYTDIIQSLQLKHDAGCHRKSTPFPYTPAAFLGT
jgi:hypothetical protein